MDLQKTKMMCSDDSRHWKQTYRACTKLHIQKANEVTDTKKEENKLERHLEDPKKQNIPMHLKYCIFDQWVLPVFTYETLAWTITRLSMEKLQADQRALERQIIGVLLRDHKRNEWIRVIIKLRDVDFRNKWKFPDDQTVEG